MSPSSYIDISGVRLHKGELVSCFNIKRVRLFIRVATPLSLVVISVVRLCKGALPVFSVFISIRQSEWSVAIVVGRYFAVVWLCKGALPSSFVFISVRRP